jgi:hypothetical protein
MVMKLGTTAETGDLRAQRSVGHSVIALLESERKPRARARSIRVLHNVTVICPQDASAEVGIYQSRSVQ